MEHLGNETAIFLPEPIQLTSVPPLSNHSLFSYAFNKGQVISTDRGRGIFQPALDTAISKLDAGQWVHLFPEGYVNLSRRMVLRRFKWGLSRLLLETKKAPRVVPIWIEGERHVLVKALPIQLVTLRDADNWDFLAECMPFLLQASTR